MAKLNLWARITHRNCNRLPCQSWPKPSSDRWPWHHIQDTWRTFSVHEREMVQFIAVGPTSTQLDGRKQCRWAQYTTPPDGGWFRYLSLQIVHFMSLELSVQWQRRSTDWGHSRWTFPWMDRLHRAVLDFLGSNYKSLWYCKGHTVLDHRYHLASLFRPANWIRCETWGRSRFFRDARK